MAIITQKIVADFETTTDVNDCRVWAACAVDINTSETIFLSNSIDSFMESLKDRNTVCFFHNLKFDGSFILSYLLSHGYRYTDEQHPDEGEFTTLITDAGVFYSITVVFKREKKKLKKVVFYDSLKKLPFKVAQISKAFQLKDEKLKIDYKAYRAPGHELTDHEKDYIVNDCRIVAQALKIQFEKGLERMTNASDALHNFKDIMGKKYFDRWFPVLPFDLDQDLRQAYKGGYVYLKPEHKGRRGLQGKTYDVNSLYPSTMYDKVLPYGYPVYFEGEPEDDPDYPLYIVRMWCSFEVKPGHLPTIQLKKNRAFIETEYLTSSRGKDGTLEIVPLTLTNVDLALFKEHYKIMNEEYEKGWKFKGKVGFFKEYIDYWMHIKETTKGPERQIAKLMLNSLYGKYGANPRSIKKDVMLDEDGVLRFKNQEEEIKDSIYVPMAAFITAYAREKTIRSAQAVYDRFIYADTDSLHLIGTEPPEGLDIHPTRLGAWKDEGTFTDSKYLRAKTYMETMHEVLKDSLQNYAQNMTRAAWIRREEDGIHAGFTKVTCAGMPDDVKYGFERDGITYEGVTYETFEKGQSFEGKLQPRQVPGGVVLVDTVFTIQG